MIEKITYTYNEKSNSLIGDKEDIIFENSPIYGRSEIQYELNNLTFILFYKLIS